MMAINEPIITYMLSFEALDSCLNSCGLPSDNGLLTIYLIFWNNNLSVLHGNEWKGGERRGDGSASR
jgi:hypothetical protein